LGVRSRTYVIMANGKGRRWQKYGGKAKHLIEVDGETLLERTVRIIQVCDPGSRVIISSSNPEYEVEGATRHVPQRCSREIDRFCYELIEDNVCFLYGDAYYAEEDLWLISHIETEYDVDFFGNHKTIVAVRAQSAFTLRNAIDGLVAMIDSGELVDAKGWELHHYLLGMPLFGRDAGDSFVFVSGETTDFNYPEDYCVFLKCRKQSS